METVLSAFTGELTSLIAVTVASIFLNVDCNSGRDSGTTDFSVSLRLVTVPVACDKM